MHNLNTVFKFEVRRIIHKKAFWIIAIAFPAMFALIAGVIYFSNKSTAQISTSLAKKNFSIGITDRSGLISNKILQELNIKIEPSKTQGLKEIKNNQLEAYFYYPSHMPSQSIQIYAQNVGIFNNTRYQSVAKNILESSVSLKIKPQIRTIMVAALQNKLNFQVSTYTKGKIAGGINTIIAPAIFLVLFYSLIVTFGGRMLTSINEEKENRVIEILLTSIETKALIIGKILSLMVLAFIQLLVLLVPVTIGYIVLHKQFALPGISYLNNIPINPERMLIGAVLFLLSFILFTGLLVSISAITPSAKDAGNLFGIVMLLVFGPLYAASLFISSPNSAIVKILTFFPFTAPVPLLLRNAVGNLSTSDVILAIIILFIACVLIMLFAIKAFKFGAMEYSRRLNPFKVFAKSK